MKEKKAITQSFEELRREIARRQFIEFAKYVYPKYIADKFHYAIADALTAIARNKFDHKGLMIFCPPQHGKSHLVSRLFPVFYLCLNPDSPIILSSYAAAHAQRLGGAARLFMQSQQRKQLFPNIDVNREKRGAEQWQLIPPYEGFMLSAGVGGPITGSGAMIGIIDDPFKNWEEAQSENNRDKVWDWYQSTFLTRLWENAKVILVMTRWHKDDIAGRIIKQERDDWLIMKFPWIKYDDSLRRRHNIICGLEPDYEEPIEREIGEILAPGRFSKNELQDRRSKISSTIWAALYDQAPSDPEGDKIKRSYFLILDQLPKDANGNTVRFDAIVRYWDPAGSTKKSSKFTAGVLMARYRDRYYILDVCRGKWDTFDRNSNMLRTAIFDREQYGSVWQIWEEEGGSSGKDATFMYKQLFQGFRCKPDRPTGSKDVRLEPFLGALENGKVFLLKGQWNDAYIDEMVSISDVRDQKDATAGAFNKLQRVFRPKGWH
ncbi:hypothetical protein D6827_01920 [Candidatus Parcubacteria bacterium]|nr:MAG: hypothetical protein D6827_01920 [Candidatus Parcubacteria bacterium]